MMILSKYFAALVTVCLVCMFVSSARSQTVTVAEAMEIAGKVRAEKITRWQITKDGDNYVAHCTLIFSNNNKFNAVFHMNNFVVEFVDESKKEPQVKTLGTTRKHALDFPKAKLVERKKRGFLPFGKAEKVLVPGISTNEIEIVIGPVADQATVERMRGIFNVVADPESELRMLVKGDGVIEWQHGQITLSPKVDSVTFSLLPQVETTTRFSQEP